MLAKLLGLENAEAIRSVSLNFRRDWPEFMLLLFLVVGVGYAVHVYWREKALSRRLRVLLTILRAIVVALLILAWFQPALAFQMTTRLRGNVLVLLDSSESMGFQDPRGRREEQLEAALALGKFSYKTPAAETAPLPPEARTASRMDLARSVLAHPELKLFETLGQEYQIRYFSFGERLEPTSGEGLVAATGLLARQPKDKATELGTAIEEALARYSGQPISGMVVLTDGAWNKGKDPLEVARELAQRQVPLYPVGLGLPAPPDLWLQNLDVLENVFSRDQVPVHVQVRSRGFRGQRTNLKILLDGAEVQKRTVVLTGEAQFEDLAFEAPAKSGTMKLEVIAEPLPGETVTENNTLSQNLRVLDEKIKVLYVEGAPRWEYRYLRAILLRDRRLDVRFLITEGDPELARYSPQYLDRFPEEAGAAFQYDLVILGDVPASYFTGRQLARLEDLVKNGGASLLVMAGPLYCPGSYAGTPIPEMLPVRVLGDVREQIAEEVHPVVTPAGWRSGTPVIDPVAARNDVFWKVVRNLCYVPRLGGAKPGAHVLLELSDAARRTEPYPLMVWQQAGSGKCMFLGTDQFWRLRFKTGDRFHARFWGQTIRFLALSRLLGANKRINLQADRTSYEARERVSLYAHVLNEAFEPLKANQYVVRLEVQGRPAQLSVRLEAVPGRPGFYQGFFVPEDSGRYAVLPEPQDQPFANRPLFDVEARSPEFQQLAMQEQLLREMAARSNGRYFSIRELPDLPAQFKKETRASMVELERELWDTPLLYLLVVACAGLEWLLRRRFDLA